MRRTAPDQARAHRCILPTMPSAVLLRRIFGQIDISGDGYISVAELRGAMEKGGKNSATAA